MGKVQQCNGKIGWLGSNGRPDVAAGHSIIAGQYKDKSPQLISDCNLCVKQAHAHSVKIRIWSIAPKDLRLVTFCDSAFDPKGERHQQGWIVGATTPQLNVGKTAPMSTIHWRSRKLTRKAGSPQLVETCVGSSTIVELVWIKGTLGSHDLDLFRHNCPAQIEPTVEESEAPRGQDGKS